jgi:ABC-type polysaccharide/polyol phosphate transport system ATPase subunit
VVDEVLSVGDQAFQRRSRDRIMSMMERGTSVVLVSHALRTVQEVAHRVMWLDHGKVQMEGPPEEVVEAYKVASAE